MTDNRDFVARVLTAAIRHPKKIPTFAENQLPMTPGSLIFHVAARESRKQSRFTQARPKSART